MSSRGARRPRQPRVGPLTPLRTVIRGRLQNGQEVPSEDIVTHYSTMRSHTLCGLFLRQYAEDVPGDPEATCDLCNATVDIICEEFS